ncbi:SGNH/GDSL hydrolase family protein [Parachryseolinea silvisoli]|uniref:SGNH/GDSL hydrolase family protein n=1 Tax=Parachryseolinea silvisoli TaxID=2873601 RepID=UPI002265C32E|nr:SGNH/GDSL hydrolase family protein [Parachryseolinea silvisoli]MCD9014354.1 SGNH/GDSL hydrolase family protein [Parachryseolinea silvisoli]
MKKIIYLGYTLSLMLLVSACDQDVIDLQQPETVADTACEDALPGAANFSKFVTIGESLVAGFQAGALFTEGQNHSLGLIIADKLKCVGGAATFNQPDINSVNGYNATYSNPGGGVVRGRLILFDSDGTGPKGPLPTPAGAPGVPAPYNTADIPGAYTGDKTKLNNFAVPGVQLVQFIAPQTGGPGVPENPAYNPLYARFASNPGTSTILGDALATQPTFFLFWGGNNDVLGYAVSGGSNEGILTSEADFQTRYNIIISSLLGSSETIKGVVGNVPDVTSIPHFTTVKYNNIPLDAATVTMLNAGFAGFNNALDATVAYLGHNAADAARRKINFAAGNNAIVIQDESLADLGDEFDMLRAANAIDDAQRAALAPYEQARQATAEDLFPLSAASVLGTIPNGGNANTIIGVTVPLADQYSLTKTEVEVVRARTTAFNNIIKTAAAQSSRIALADVNATFTGLVTAGAQSQNNVTITPNFAPPTGAFSEDGVHPNSRGYAYTANIFINAINAKFGSTIPLVNIGAHGGTPLPVSPAGL